MSATLFPGGSSMTSRTRTTLLAENVGQDYAELAHEQGKIRAWHLGHKIGVFESTGILTGEHSSFTVSYFEKHIEQYPRPYAVFGNWARLKAYSPEVRKTLTDWQVRAKYEELHVAHDSKMLAMSISVANSVIASTIVVHPTEEELDDALLEIRKKFGV